MCEKLDGIPGLTPVMPRGAMYLMVGIDPAKFKDIKNDVDFTQKLLREQSVFCLPAAVFDSPNFFRIVTSVPKVHRRAPCSIVQHLGSVTDSPTLTTLASLTSFQERMTEAVDRIVEFTRAHLV